MSWGVELWDQYGNISDHTQKGIDFCEKFAHFVKERCAIENDYANKLRKLVRNYVPKVDRNDKKKEQEELSDLAGQHECIAEKMTSDILKDLQTAIQEVKQERKRLLTEGSKQQNLLQNHIAQLDKAKKHYEKAFRDAEKAQEAYKRAENDINLSKADIEKQKQTANGKVQASDDSKSEYALELQKANQAQREHYENVMPQIFQQLQEMDEKRINKVQRLISSSTDIERSVMPIMTKCIDGMSAAAQMIDCKQDSQLVIEQYKTGFVPPNDIAFEDLSTTGSTMSPVSSSLKPDTVRGGTITGGKPKKRSGLRALFNAAKVEEPREDFGHLPPIQQRKQLTLKLESLQTALNKETSERDALLKMQDVYRQNTALGDPTSLDPQLEENAQKLDHLQREVAKYQNFLANIDKNGNMQQPTDTSNVTSSTVPASSPEPPSEQVSLRDSYVQQDDTHRKSTGTDKRLTGGFNDSFEDDDDLGMCVAVYQFDANTESALSMAEGEQLTVIEADQGDGWTHVRNTNGDSGFVPTSYIQFS